MPKVAGSTPSQSMDFHDAENRQGSCRMILRHAKDPYSICLVWVLSAKLNPSAGSHYQSSLVPKLGVKIVKSQNIDSGHAV
ncbi:hypothetical protein TNCV_4654001 [Trichonephila clavipes]|nr:hypothetical protein TNCV_4654001 [Trichonephila clavipes]